MDRLGPVTSCNMSNLPSSRSSSFVWNKGTADHLIWMQGSPEKHSWIHCSGFGLWGHRSRHGKPHSHWASLSSAQARHEPWPGLQKLARPFIACSPPTQLKDYFHCKQQVLNCPEVEVGEGKRQMGRGFPTNCKLTLSILLFFCVRPCWSRSQLMCLSLKGKGQGCGTSISWKHLCVTPSHMWPWIIVMSQNDWGTVSLHL